MAMVKGSLLAVFVLAVLACGLVGSLDFGTAQTTPAVPEFSLKFVDNSYDYYVPPVTTTTIDPYTGKQNVTTVPGYTEHVENKFIEITITNQPFTSYKDENGTYVNLYYDLRSKGHFEEEWHNANPSIGSYHLYNSTSPTTIITKQSNNIPDGGQKDFQIRALIGKFVRVYGTPVPPFGTPYNDVFVGEASEWSNTQTITIPETSPSTSTASPSQTPTLTLIATPTQLPSASSTGTSTSTPSSSTVSSQPIMQAFQVDQYLVVAVVLAGALVIMGAVVVVLLRKNRKLAGGKQ